MLKIATIGYEKAQIEEVIEALSAFEVRTLVDIRELPISRNRPFAKRNLKTAIEAAGMAYLHVKALGDPKPGRDAARAGDYSRFVEIFQAHLSADPAQAALASVEALVRKHQICLLCFEREPTYCHRSIVADTLATRVNGAVTHLEADRRGRLQSIRTRTCLGSREGTAARW